MKFNDRKNFSTALVLITFAGFVAVPILLLHSNKIRVLNSFLQEHPEINLLDLFTSATDYLSLGITLFLGVIVYRQSQKINDLESSQYDVFIGTDGMDDSLTPFSDVLVEDTICRSDFFIKQGVSGGKMSFFTYLKTNFPDNRQLMFLPISFVTRNQPIIVSLKFSEISLVIIESNGRKSDPQKFLNHAEPIHWIFENDSRFLLGIGFMLPEAMTVGQILLQIRIDVADQLGRITPLILLMTLQNIDKRLYLLSTQTKRVE